MDGKRGVAILLVAFLILGLGSSAVAINGKSNRATLRGLKGVGVLVENLSPEAEKEGLSRAQLQADVESKLRKAGIKILTKDESAKVPGEPYLYVNINLNTAKTEDDVYPYSLDILLIQKVSLLRDPKITTYAVTWSTGGVGSISKQTVGELRENVKAIVDVFIKAYHAENPK